MAVKPNQCIDLTVPVFHLNGIPIDMISKHKYLGVILSDDNRDDLDIKRQIRSVNARGNTILKNIRHCTHEVKCTLFKTYCTNLYCPHLWSNYNVTTFASLKVAFNESIGSS